MARVAEAVRMLCQASVGMVSTVVAPQCGHVGAASRMSVPRVVILRPLEEGDYCLSSLELGTVVAHHDAPFHHETYGAQRVDVLERIGIERVDVGVLACA